MVSDAVLDWFFDLLEWLVSLFPAAETAPMQAMDFSWIAGLNYFLPIGEMFGLFVAFFALGGPLVGTSLIIWWFVGIIRGGATKA